MTLWIALWGAFVSNVTLTILTIALPSIARDLGSSPAATNWVTLGPMLVVALCTPASGRAADVWGRKRIWITGLGLSLLGMAASALAPSLTPLLLARVVTAVGTALLLPASLSILSDLYPPEKRATPVGYWTSVMGLSPLCGVLIGGALLDTVSWRFLFVGQVALGLPALFLAAYCFEERKFPQRGRFDVEGSSAIGLSALSLMLAASWLGSADTRAWALAAGCVSVVCAFWAVSAERRAAEPVLPPRLMGTSIVQLSLASRVSVTFSYMGAFMIMPYLLKEVWQLPAITISALLIWRPLAMGLSGPLAGPLAARFGSAKLVLWGAYGVLVASALFIGLDAHPNHLLLVFGLAIAGAGLGLAGPGAVAVVVERVGSEMLGSVSSLTTLAASLSNAIGMAAMFAAVEATGGVRAPEAYRASFIVGTVMSLIGVIFAHLLLRRVRTRAPGGTLEVP